MYRLLLLLLAAPSLAFACWDEAAARYGVAPSLLRAVARVESSLNPNALNLSHVERTGSFDIGLMQINSRWLPKLAQYGIDGVALRDPCTNVQVGTWLMADLFRRFGVSWEAVGAYNAACTSLKGQDCKAARMRYAWLVYRAMRREVM